MGFFDFLKAKKNDNLNNDKNYSEQSATKTSSEDFYRAMYGESRLQRSGVIKINTDSQMLNFQQQAINYYDNKDYQKALVYASKAIDRDSSNNYNYNLRASIKEDMGDVDGALEDFKKTLYYGEDWYAIYHSIATLYLKKQEPSMALKAIEIAFKLKESNKNIEQNLPYVMPGGIVKRVELYVMYANKANAELQLKQHDRAERDIEKSIELNPNYARAYYLKGMNYLAMNDKTKGLRFLNIAAEKGDAFALMMLSQLGQSQKNDKYSQMIDNAVFNPFKLTTASQLQVTQNLPDLVNVFKGELQNYAHNAMIRQLQDDKTIVKSYVFNLIESYYNNAGYVPQNALDQVLDQVYKAMQNTDFKNTFRSFDNFKYEIYYSFLNN